MNGRNDRVRAHAKQCLLRGLWPLPSDREIPGYWENLESKVKRAHQSRARSVPPNWLQLAAAAPTNRAIPVRNFIYRAPERLEPGLSLPGVQRSIQLSYGTGKGHVIHTVTLKAHWELQKDRWVGVAMASTGTFFWRALATWVHNLCGNDVW